MEAPGIGTDDVLALDIDFHVAVSRAAHNAILELAMNAIHPVPPVDQHDARPAVEHRHHRRPAPDGLRGDRAPRRGVITCGPRPITDPL
jgi:DNA-binding FadR family transcriptional regulator